MLYKGTLGTAILSGILQSLCDSSSSTTVPDPDTTPSKVPNRFITCNTRQASSERITKALSQLDTEALARLELVIETRQNDNVRSVQQADVVLLACKPYLAKNILRQEGMTEALKDKLVISILAGMSVEQLNEIMHERCHDIPKSNLSPCRFVRVMPNTASLIRESMTVIETSSPPLPPDQDALVTWMFSRIGRVVHLSAQQMDASTALCGSGPAFYALMLEAMADGAVAMGIPRAEAQLMAAQTMRGAAGLVLNGEHPAIVREKVSTPGGCTIGGLLVLEEGSVRGTIARGVREATVVASQLGRGVQGVNGTRFRV